MSNINTHNYEAFYLDYLEGNLNQEDIDKLFVFLEKNPSLKIELEACDQIVELNADPIPFDKTTLYKTINNNNVDDYIIAAIENEIEAEDAIELTAFLNQSTEANLLAERYKKTRLPIEKITYPHKNKLKKKRAVVYYLTPIISAAAVLLIIIWVNTRSEETTNISTDSIVDTSLLIDIDTLVVNKKTASVNSKSDAVEENNVNTVANTNLSSVKTNQKVAPKSAKDTSSTQNYKSKENIKINHLPDDVSDHQKVAITLPDTIEFIPDIDLEKAVADLILDQENDQEQITSSIRTNEPLTIRKWATKVLREKVFKQKASDTSPIDRNEVFVAVLNKIDQNSKKIKVVYHEESETENQALSTSQFSFTIGKFQYTRIKTR